MELLDKYFDSENNDLENTPEHKTTTLDKVHAMKQVVLRQIDFLAKDDNKKPVPSRLELKQIQDAINQSLLT